MQPVRYTLSDADIVSAQRGAFASGWTWRRVLPLMAAIFAVLGAVLLLDGRPLAALDAAPFVGAAVAALLVPAILYWRLPRRTLKLFRQQKTAALETTLSWDAEAISFVNETGHIRLTWTLFQSWLNAPETLSLFQSDLAFNPIPKRVLEAGEVADIIGRLRAAGVSERRHRFGLRGPSSTRG